MIQIVAFRKKGDATTPAMVYTEPKLLCHSIKQALTQASALLHTHLPLEEHWNLFYTLANHTGAGEGWTPVRSIKTFATQSVLAFDIDKADTSKAKDYAYIVADVLHVPQSHVSYVDSGNGVHVLFNLRTPIRDANYFKENKDAYREICARIDAVLQEKGYPGFSDPSCFDAARVLRLPATLNIKPSQEDKRCTLIHWQDALVDIDLKVISGLKDFAAENIAPQEVKRCYPTPDFPAIVRGCAFVKHYIENPSEIHEPQAFDLFSLLYPQPDTATVTLGGVDYSPKSLAAYLKDNASDSASLRGKTFESKWNDAGKYGARKCQTIASNGFNCTRCAYYAKIPSPLAITSKDHIGSEAVGYWRYNKNGNPTEPHYEDLAKVFRKEHPYVTGGGDIIWGFKRDHYVEIPARNIKGWVEKAVNPPDFIKEGHRLEFYNKLRAKGAITASEEKELFLTNLKGKINCRNGIVDVMTGELHPHSPAYGFKSVLPYDYDPNATCPAFVDWIARVLCDDVDLITAALDFMAYCFVPGHGDHLFVFLTGVGKNGKSTFMDLLKRLVGEDNASSVSLKQLVNNRFAPANLDGKMLNTSGEASDYEVTLQEANKLKELTGGDSMEVERKGEQPYTFYNSAKLVFSANTPPRFTESGDAIKRRLLTIPFNYKIDEDGMIQGMDEKLMAEAPGILTLLIQRIKLQYETTGQFKVFRGGRSALKAREDMLIRGDTAVEWAREHLVVTENSDDFLTTSDCFMSYMSWCDKENIRYKKTHHKFTTTVCEVAFDAPIWKTRRIVGDARVMVFVGVRLKTIHDD